MQKMKKLVAGLVLGAGLGAGGYAGMDAITDGLFYSRQELNAPVERCAKGLGEVAIVSETLPPHCDRYDFKSIVTQTVVERPDKPDKVTNKSREYILPGRGDYLRDNLVTKEEDEAQRRDQAWIASINGISFGLVGFGAGWKLITARESDRNARARKTESDFGASTKANEFSSPLYDRNEND